MSSMSDAMAGPGPALLTVSGRIPPDLHALTERGRRPRTDYVEIASRGVMSTPAVAVDGVVVLAGRVPTPAQVAGWLGLA